jgi:ATP-binding cassette, subfamily F, member 3
MISAQNLSKKYGHQVVFDKVSFSMGQGERVGLIGRNGHGKTTLFRLITGEELPDEGEIIIPRDYRIGYLKQELRFTRSTLLEEAGLGLPHGQASELWKAKKILSGLGFSEEDYDRNPKEFSGGYHLRLQLAQVLLSEPDLLLLDEPTNFLDILSIRWMIRFLRSFPREFIVISHDRSFIDSIVTHVLGIHRHRLRKFEGRTEAYYSQIAKEEEVHEKRRVNIEKKHEQDNRFIERFRAKATKASVVQSRIKRLEKEQKLEKLSKITTLSFSFNAAPFPAKFILEAKDLAFSYNGAAPCLIENFHMTVERRDRICIIGKNGKGKTTLMKLLEGTLPPLKGSLWHHPSALKAYFEQGNTARLNDKLTVEEELMAGQQNADRKKCRDICGAMMFSGIDAEKAVGVLSGGEKSRVLLGKLLLSPANILLLDEPTHHLDMESCEAIIEAVEDFPGAAIIITHNEEFLHRVAKKLVVFHRGGVMYYPGGYADFLENMGWVEEEEAAASGASQANGGSSGKALDRKQLKHLRAQLITRRGRALSPFKKEAEHLEKEIVKAEHRLSEETLALVKASEEKDVRAIVSLSQSIQQNRSHIEALYLQLAKVTEEYEEQKRVFEEEEKALSQD